MRRRYSGICRDNYVGCDGCVGGDYFGCVGSCRGFSGRHGGNAWHFHFAALPALRRRADEQIACRIETETRLCGGTVGLHAFHEKAECAKIARNMLEFRTARLAFEFWRSEAGYFGAHIAYRQRRFMLVEYRKRAFDLMQDAVDGGERRALR